MTIEIFPFIIYYTNKLENVYLYEHTYTYDFEQDVTLLQELPLVVVSQVEDLFMIASHCL